MSQVENGFAIETFGSANLCWLRAIILLGDHEGMRSATGSKGAAGKKPCCKCCNVLSMASEIPDRHVSIAEPDATKFAKQTELSQVLEVLQTCRTKEQQKKMETRLGWSKAALERGVLNSTVLRDMVNLDSIYYDAMHQYFSNGMVAQELGLWYSRMTQEGFTLDTFLRWINIGWTYCRDTRKFSTAINAKLFRVNEDYRGDAAQCLVALPLAWAFSKEILTKYAWAADICESIDALYQVTCLIQQIKISANEVAKLPDCQKRHMEGFQNAYGARSTRPKAHYSRHLFEQVQKWGKLIDCFVTERKHKEFKSRVAPLLHNPHDLSKSGLLSLTENALVHGHRETELTGESVGTSNVDPKLASSLGLSDNAQFCKGWCQNCVTLQRGQFIQTTAMSCFEIHGCAIDGTKQFMIVETLRKGPATTSQLPFWLRTEIGKQLLPVNKAQCFQPFQFVRRCHQKTWLLY